MSDWFSDIFDAFLEFLEDVVDAIGSAAESLWKNILAPLIEEFFNILGFEDQTIINGYMTVSRVYTDPWENPYKQAVISKVSNGTTMSDEIKNIHLTGFQARIKNYMAYGENGYYYGLPEAGFEVITYRPDIIENIIEAEEGYSINIDKAALGGIDDWHYTREWLQDNEGTHGYTWVGGDEFLLGPGVTYKVLDIYFDAVANKFDIDVYQWTDFYIEVLTAINVDATITPTYEWSPVIYTAITEPLSLVSTYDVTVGATIAFTIDTAVGNVTPTISGALASFTPNTAEAGPAPTGMVAEGASATASYVTLQNIIPAKTGAGRGYNVTYKPVSDSSSSALRYFTYRMYTGDPNTGLYATTPNPGNDIDKILPIAPICLQGVWQEEGHGITPATKHTTTNILLKKMDLKKSELITSLDGTQNGSRTIYNAFFMFGVNINVTDSDLVRSYFWEFLNQTVVGAVDDNWDEYVTTKSRYNSLLNGSDGSQDNVLDIIFPGWETNKMPWYARNPPPLPYPYTSSNYYAARGLVIAEGLSFLKTQQSALTTRISIKEATYNINMSIGAVRTQTTNEVIGPVGTTTITTAQANYEVNVKKQVNSTQTINIQVLELIGFTALESSGNDIAVTKLDHAGNDNGGQNVANNFLVPMSYGILTQFSTLERKQLAYEMAHLVVHNENVTELRYYETAGFIEFFDLVIKVAAVVYLFYTGGDVSGAEFLWTVASSYAYGVAIEYIITQIVLANPNSELAIALGTAFAVVGGIYMGTSTATAIDKALLGINALSQTTSVYIDVKADILQDEALDFQEYAKNEEAKLEDLFEEASQYDSMLNFMKKTVMHRVETPEQFFGRTQNAQPTDEFLNIARKLDLNFMWDEPLSITTTTDNSLT